MYIEDVSTTAAGDGATAGTGTNAGAGTSAGCKISADDAMYAMFKYVTLRDGYRRLNKKAKEKTNAVRVLLGFH
jgi:hypothetical protein